MFDILKYKDFLIVRWSKILKNRRMISVKYYIEKNFFLKKIFCLYKLIGDLVKYLE